LIPLRPDRMSRHIAPLLMGPFPITHLVDRQGGMLPVGINLDQESDTIIRLC
jgi:hypothetical protein